MASLLSPRRPDGDVVLHASAPAYPAAAAPAAPAASVAVAAAPRVGWVVTAAAGGLLCSAAGWVLAAGLAVVGWLAGAGGSLGAALSVGTRLWLAGHGVPVTLAGLPVSLVPWGLPALLAVLLARAAAAAARSARPDQTPGPLRVALLVTAAALLPADVVAVPLGRPAAAPLHVLAVVAVLLAAALRGSAGVLGLGWTRRWPTWAAGLPRGVLAAQLVLLLAGAVVLTTGLARHLARVTALHDALAPGLAGGTALLAAQLALTPNALAWAASYALGSGFTLGAGSVVAPAATQVGVLPGLPLLGALPAPGPGPGAALGWLAGGVLAGAVAGWLALRHRPVTRLDASALVGGVAGLLAGLAFVPLAWVSGGDLGSGRLAGLGPLLRPLLVMAPTTLGLAGLVTGLVVGLLPRPGREEPAPARAEDEVTEVLDRP